jgi:heme-degrading monooxygenase HmoA
MYARIVTVKINPKMFEEAIAIYRDSIVPTAKEQRGNVSMMLLGDEATGKVQSISMWETEADERTSALSGYLQTQFAKLGTMMVTPPTHEAYEVWVKA